MELDVKDKKLIAELEKEGDLPLSSIAKKIGVSKEVAHYRVKQLTEKGIIKSFMPVIDNLYLGYRCYRLIINLQNLRPNARKQIVDYLRSKQDVEVSAFLFSNWDIDVKIWA
ncbi:MAG TPA: winged helix-turn-helix transcriptional regulator, partial [Candidatus Nanoarchaeia archaeon]|nr:winged helix-turn-helix transcriptional regulator [Candidatus Nanoarchaeia archaeon]